MPRFPRTPPGDGAVTLRRHRPGDLPALLAEGRDPAVQRYTNTPAPYDEDAARAELAEFADWWRVPSGRVAFAIAAAAGDGYLGTIIVILDRPDGIVELGYSVAPAARGRGVAARAVALAAAWAFAEAGAARVEARVEPDNTASARALERAGFTREGLERRSRTIRGTRRDVVCYSLLPDDPRP